MSATLIDEGPTVEDLKKRSPDTLIRYIRLLRIQIEAERAQKEDRPMYTGDCALLKRQAE